METKKKRGWGLSIWFGASLLAILVVIAIFAPIFLDASANELTGERGALASAQYPLGTDDFGRNNVARALVATRLTLVMTALATLISVLGGLIAGVGVWLVPERLRQLSLRLLETAAAYPSLIFALVVAAILSPTPTSTVIAIGLAGIPGFARLTANLAGSLSVKEYITNARLFGVNNLQIAVRHMLPNMAEPILILISTVFALSLVDLSALSFIGLGVQPPQYDFGRLLNDSLNSLYVQPIQAVGPSVMIILTGLSAMLIGDGLAARANPRTRNRIAAAKQRLGESTPTTGETEKALVKVDQLRVSSQTGAELVKGVSFEITKGQVVALVGESGSGKSLTAMAIAGLLDEQLLMSANELSFAGINMLGRLDRKRLAKEMAIVYQDPNTTFNPAMRMGTQLAEVLRTHYGLPADQRRSRIEEGLQAVEIREPKRRMKQRPYEFSGGMLQRAMIATAMSTDARFLIADEPTTALDVTVQMQVLKQLRRANRERGMAMLFISHDLGVVQELADVVLVMRDGEIVEELTGDDLRGGRVSSEYTQRLLNSVPHLSETTIEAISRGREG